MGLNLSGKKFLITGGAGMLGSTLALAVVKAGAAVRIVDAMLPLYGGNRLNLAPMSDAIEFIEGDIRDSALMDRVVADMDYVFDLAAQVSYTHSNRDPLLDVDINCRGHINVLEACRKNAPAAKLIFSSSRFVYGTIEKNPVKEDHPVNCRSIYGIHKLAVEKYLQFYADYYGLNTLSLRIANPYGPRQQMKHNGYGIVNWFIRLALDGKPLTIYGEGQQLRDYIYVTDVADAFVAVALSDTPKGAIYNLGSGAGTSFRDMVYTVAELIPGTEVQQVPWPTDRYFVETGDYISDNSAIHAVTGWRASTDLRSGIAGTIEYYRQYRESYWQSAKNQSP